MNDQTRALVDELVQALSNARQLAADMEDELHDLDLWTDHQHRQRADGTHRDASAALAAGRAFLEASPVPKLVVYEEGGLIQGYSATEPVEIVQANYDSEDVSSAHTENEKWGGDHLVTYVHGRETAVYAPDSAEVRPEQVACIHALAHAHYDSDPLAEVLEIMAEQAATIIKQSGLGGESVVTTYGTTKEV